MSIPGRSVLALVALLAGCHRAHGDGIDSGAIDGAGIDDRDAASPGPRDAAAIDAAPPAAGATIDTDGDGVADAAADLGCIGARTAPVARATVSFTAHTHDFQGGTATPSAGIELHVFPDGAIGPGCAGSCIAVTTDAMGDAIVAAPEGSWIAYRSLPPADGDPVTTLGYQRVVPAAGDTLMLPTVSRSVLGLIPSLYARSRVAGTGLVFGAVSDCNGETIAGARLRVFSGGAELLPGPLATDPFYGYFSASSGLPSRSATATDVDGVFVAANVPLSPGPLHIELWAAARDGEPVARIACEEIELAPDGATIIRPGPSRADYPAGHPCR